MNNYYPRVLDMHSHFLINAFLLGKRFERRHGSAWLWNPFRNQYDLPRAQEGGVCGATFTIYEPYWPGILGGGMAAVRAFKRRYDLIIERCVGAVVPCTSAQGVRDAFAEGKFASLLSVEGAHVLDGKMENLHELRSMGIRTLTLVHFFSTNVGEAVWGRKRRFGLTPFGRELVREMQRIGMIVDLAHTERNTFYAAMDMAESPCVVSHTGFTGAGAGSRGVDDEQIKAIRGTGGVIGIIFFPWYLKNTTIFASIDLVADHIAYGAEKAGVEHVCIGTDCDSNIWLPRGFKDVSCFPLLTEALLKRGFTLKEISMIYMENHLRVLDATDARFHAP